MFGLEHFEIKPEHIKLLTNTYVSWFDCEFGSPSIDPKRPYGNSDVYNDIAELIELKPANKDCDYYDRYSDEQIEYMDKLHKETKTVLNIILQTQSFELGMYERKKYGGRWYKI